MKSNTNTYKKRFKQRLFAGIALVAMTQNVFATTGLSIPLNGTTDTYDITVSGPVIPGDVITIDFDSGDPIS